MATNQNSIGNKEFTTLIEKAKKAYEAIIGQETKNGKNIYMLGNYLHDLKAQIKNIGYDTFEDLCKKEFNFSRQYGHRMIKFYKVQNELHERGQLDKESFLPCSMLLTLTRSKKPSETWEKAREIMDPPTEKIISQLLEDKTEEDILEIIKNATAKNIVKVLVAIKKHNHYPSEAEQKCLISLLKESWEINNPEASNESPEEGVA